MMIIGRAIDPPVSVYGMKKNDIVEIVITDMTEEGAGLGKAEGYPLFVKDTVIGDRVRALVIKDKKTYGFGKLLEVLEASSDRVKPECPVAGPCGGCQLQAMSYEAQLRFKRGKVQADLERIGGLQDVEVLPVIGMEDHRAYRNKEQYPVGRDRNGRLVAGFYAGRTHSIIPCEQCCIAAPITGEIVRRVLAWMEENRIEPYDEETGKGLVRHIMTRTAHRDGNTMVCLVINGKKLPAKEALARTLSELPSVKSICFNINEEKGNAILGQDIRPVYGEPWLEDDIGEVHFRISPLAFFQVNPVQTEKLYGKALEFAGLTGGETVWDLYCGIGTISLFLAQKARKVYGVEIIPAAIENARSNAVLNGFDNTEFFVGKAEEVLPEHYRRTGERADVIVVDPPRKGCDAVLLDTLVQMAPERIVYVSCNPATLARDLKELTGKGYRVEKVQPVDMFPETVHVECVVLLSKHS